MLVRRLIAAALTALLTWAPIGAAHAETCTKDTLRRVVDEAGARLRVLTAETQPRIMATLRRLKEKRGWTGSEADEKASALIADERTAELDSKAAALLARIDELSEISTTGEPDCSRLTELEATSLELQATVRAKSQHILARLEAEAGGGPQTAEAPSAPAQSAPSAAQPAAPLRPAVPDGKDPPVATKDLPAAAKETPAAGKEPPSPTPAQPREPSAPHREASAQPSGGPQQPAAKPRPPTVTGWSTETSEQLPKAPGAETNSSAPPMPPIPQEPAGSFSREEIAEASRGFFGTISGGLASVIEHAFSTLGRPTGYVLGSEGGGAFIAGLRYGKGTLFLSDGSRREVHWHGPSIGYDFGASGSKTLFLVYNLKRDIDIFTGYSGVDGSAYLVGGVGMTLLTDGKVVMAPIRSGLGVRLGANIGYIRFTPRATWNPF